MSLGRERIRCFRAVGKAVDAAWKACGFSASTGASPVEKLWPSCGKPPSSLWISCGSAVDALWTDRYPSKRRRILVTSEVRPKATISLIRALGPLSSPPRMTPIS